MKQKIIDLFEYRRIPELIELAHIKKSNRLLKWLVGLQMSIYDLDQYLEDNWEIKETKLEKQWKSIHQAMIQAGVQPSNLMEYSKHIQRYQSHELELRKGKTPVKKSMEYYYYYKSCDVRLMRRIIYDNSEELVKTFALPDWRYFDLITEVNDDIEDLKEDMKTINGNLWMLSLIELGKTASEEKFSEFIDLIHAKDKQRLEGSKNPNYGYISSWVDEQVKVTRKLLVKGSGKISKKKLLKSKMAQKLSI